jgi:ZIP family zinc transporter
MSELGFVVLVSWLAGFAAFIGGILSHAEGSPETEAKREIIHGVIALGGGILLAAVAFALVPVGMVLLSPLVLSGCILAGGVSFCFLDVFLSKHGGAKSQFTAMLVDFIPEAISLGAVFVHDHRLGYLLALFIGAQNLPEGFNAFRELQKLGIKWRVALVALLSVSLLGPIAASAGFFFLDDLPKLTAGIMAFSGGGIMYLIFQDIAPQAKLRRHWTPPLGAVVGFLLGALGKQMIG